MRWEAMRCFSCDAVKRAGLVAMEDWDWERMQGDARQAAPAAISTYLFHDTSFALGEGDVPARLVLDELDLDLAPFAPGLVVVVVVVVRSAGARALDASALQSAIAVVQVIWSGGRVGLVVGGDLGHVRYRK